MEIKISHEEWIDLLEKHHKAKEITKYNEAFNAGVETCITTLIEAGYFILPEKLERLKK